MKTYLIISITTFALLGLFVLGALFGDVDDYIVLYLISGGIAGILFWFLTKNHFYSSGGIHSFFQLLMFSCWAVAVLALVYGGYGVMTNKDMITGERYDEMAGLIPYIGLVFAVFSGFAGFLFAYLTARYSRKQK